MRCPVRLPVASLIAGIASLTILAAAPAAAQQPQPPTKQQQQQQKKAAAAAAKSASDSAKAAEQNAASAKKKLADLNAQIKAAEKEVSEAARALKAVEDETIDGQAADSDFGKLRDEYRAADKKYQDARQAVLNSDQYKARLAKARDSDDTATAVSALKKEFDEMPEISDSLGKLQDVKERYEPQRTKLLQAESKWVDADTELREKRKALQELEHQFDLANAAARKARLAAKKAADAAATAQNIPNQPGKKTNKHGNGY
jgi:septal ring factor EnvC (AmiA/AmiB activator)